MVIEIQLTQGKVALVDDEDGDLAEFGWYASKGGNTFYARRSIKKDNGERTGEMMHRVIMARMTGDPLKVVDHIDRNGLNNCRHNLRNVTQGENLFNSRSKGKHLKGVHWNKPRNKFQAQITINGKKIHLGYFLTEQAAHLAYQRAAMERSSIYRFS